MKKAFTLAETLITLMIIGVISALLIRGLSRVTPDKEKALFIKAFHTIEQVVADTINDPNKYDQEYGSTTNHDFSTAPIPNDTTGTNHKMTINGTSYTVTATNALCLFTAEKLNVVGSISCTSAGSATSPNFTTSNGIKWYNVYGTFPTTASSPKVINIQVSNESNAKTFSINVYRDGKVGVPSGTETTYLQNQAKIR